MMSEAAMLDFIVRTGIPAGLGVVVVMYLLKSLIPEMQKKGYPAAMAAAPPRMIVTSRKLQGA